MQKLLIVLMSLALASCAAAQAKQANIARFQSTIPMCTSGDDCSMKWSAAFRWIQDHCAFRIQQYNDAFISTYQSGDYANPNLACEAVREPLGNGRFRIVARFWINNAFSAGEAEEKMVEFNDYVNQVVVPAAN